MSSWGNNDNAANAPYWAVETVSSTNAPDAAAPTAANVALLYGNTQFQAYTQGMKNLSGAGTTRVQPSSRTSSMTLLEIGV